MILRGGRVALGARRAERLDVTIRGGRIAGLGNAARGIDVRGHLILPGLINAHDHLSFNLFPLLGNPPYPDATAWAHDVYRPEEPPVREHRRVPRDVRLAWGALKNLVSGVTTVAHHDPDPPQRGWPVRIAQAGWAHSLAFTPDIARRFRLTPRGRPFILHAGESTGLQGAEEIFELDELGVLDGWTAIVHGVAFDARGLRLIRKRGAALIACPVSNLYTLRQTLKRPVFASGIPIALGTDSAITAPGDLLDALRAAKSIWRLSNSRLYEMVTTIPARILRLDGGEIREGAAADVIVMRDPGSAPADALLELSRVEIVIVAGKVRLVSPRFAGLAIPSFERLTILGRGNFLVDAPVRKLFQEATARLGAEIRLAGRRVRIR